MSFVLSYNRDMKFIPWLWTLFGFRWQTKLDPRFTISRKVDAEILLEFLTESWTNFNGGTNLSEMELFPAKLCRPLLSIPSSSADRATVSLIAFGDPR